MKRTTGFTLIELLIVVAIIAILAAIAVPNFLEAQVRAKVSRTVSDQRSLATAIESYTVDSNRPPLGMWEDSLIFGAPGTDEAKNNAQMGRIYSQLTTPIAYMTSIPLQTFVEKGGVGAAGTNSFYRKVFTYQASSTLSIRGTETKNAAIIGMNRLGKSWMLAGYGPSRSFLGGPANAVAEIADADVSNGYGFPSIFYDPTNGTVSFGYIIRSSAGIEPVKKK